MKTMLPQIHMNGSGAKALAEQAEAARQALYAAQEALSAAAPNARDYYTIGDDAFRVARAEHEARQTALREMLEHFERVQLRAMGED
jgi:hypothetical protein